MFRRLIRRKTLTKDLTFLNMEQGKKYRELTTDPIEYDVKKNMNDSAPVTLEA